MPVDAAGGDRDREGLDGGDPVRRNAVPGAERLRSTSASTPRSRSDPQHGVEHGERAQRRRHLPQDSTLDPNGLAESAPRSSTLVLPEGLQASAGVANGLETCGAPAVGFEEGAGSLGGSLKRSSSSPLPGCPERRQDRNRQRQDAGARQGTRRRRVPRHPEHEPLRSLLVLYIVAEDENTSVRVKLAGEVKLDPEHGPAHLDLHRTRRSCPSKTAIQLFGGRGRRSPRPRGAAPTPPRPPSRPGRARPVRQLNARTSRSPRDPTAARARTRRSRSPRASRPAHKPQAGAFTPFTLTLARPDADQALSALTVHLPPGIAAMLASSRPVRNRPPARRGSAGRESRSGTATASRGPRRRHPSRCPATAYLTRATTARRSACRRRRARRRARSTSAIVIVRRARGSTSTRDTAAVTTDAGPHKRRAADDGQRRIPAQLKRITRHDRPPELPVQPDELRPDVDRRRRSAAPKARAQPPRRPSRSAAARRCRFTRS